jgi:hypothetical protein
VAAACLAGVTRNQVQHHVDKDMIIFKDREAAIFTADVLLCCVGLARGLHELGNGDNRWRR